VCVCVCVCVCARVHVDECVEWMSWGYKAQLGEVMFVYAGSMTYCSSKPAHEHD